MSTIFRRPDKAWTSHVIPTWFLLEESQAPCHCHTTSIWVRELRKENREGRGESCDSIIPIPREATSVATMIGLLPVLNSFKTQSLSCCCLSPWIAGIVVSKRHWGNDKMIRRLTKCGPSVLAEESSNLISNALSAGENQTLVATVFHDFLEVLNHLVALFEVGNDLDNLSNSVVSRQVHGTDVHLDVVVQEVRSELTDFLGPSGGPHAGLSVRTNLRNNLANLRFETHVQHAVSFVKNEVRDTAEVGPASFQHVNQTTRGCDADFDTAAQITNLRALGNTTIDASVANPGRLSELADFGLNLNSKLTGRSKDEDNRTIAGSKERLSVDVYNGRETVGKCLSGTSFSNTDDIPTRKSHWPTLRLNGSRTLEALSLDLTQDVLGEPSLVEILDGTRNIASLHSHLVLLAELLNLALRASGNIGMLFVE